MVELCFVLDLRSLPPPFLRDLKLVIEKQAIRFNTIFQIIHKICHTISASIHSLTNCIRFFSGKFHQSLLQLANLYAISSTPSWRRTESLRDRIGLCYVFQNPISLSDEVGNFEMHETCLRYVPGESESERLNIYRFTAEDRIHAESKRKLQST